MMGGCQFRNHSVHIQIYFYVIMLIQINYTNGFPYRMPTNDDMPCDNYLWDRVPDVQTMSQFKLKTCLCLSTASWKIFICFCYLFPACDYLYLIELSLPEYELVGYYCQRAKAGVCTYLPSNKQQLILDITSRMRHSDQDSHLKNGHVTSEMKIWTTRHTIIFTPSMY